MTGHGGHAKVSPYDVKLKVALGESFASISVLLLANPKIVFRSSTIPDSVLSTQLL